MKTIEIDLDVHRRIEMARQGFDESENSILRRLLRLDHDRRAAPARQRASRNTGAYATRLGDIVVEARSLKGLLRRTILAGERASPGLIEKLAKEATPKGRRIVARTPEALYPKPHLVEFAEPLKEGWWFDTNVGRTQIANYLRKIARAMDIEGVPTIQQSTPIQAESDQD